MAWFKACGDESCDTCGKAAVVDADFHYNKDTDKTRCEVCVDREEDDLIGLCEASDPRYSHPTYR